MYKIQIQAITIDIFEHESDAIVNPTNKWLLAGSGLCGEIYRRAGKELLEPVTRKICEDQFDGEVPCGTAMVTDAHALPFKKIIHVVPPKYFL